MQAQTFLQQLGKWTAAALGLCYVVAGLLLMLFEVDLLQLGLAFRIAFGSLLLIYGCFRIVRALKRPTLA